MEHPDSDEPESLELTFDGKCFDGMQDRTENHQAGLAPILAMSLRKSLQNKDLQMLESALWRFRTDVASMIEVLLVKIGNMEVGDAHQCVEVFLKLFDRTPSETKSETGKSLTLKIKIGKEDYKSLRDLSELEQVPMETMAVRLIQRDLQREELKILESRVNALRTCFAFSAEALLVNCANLDPEFAQKLLSKEESLWD